MVPGSNDERALIDPYCYIALVHRIRKSTRQHPRTETFLESCYKTVVLDLKVGTKLKQLTGASKVDSLQLSVSDQQRYFPTGD